MCTAMDLAKHTGKADLVQALDLVDAATKTGTEEQFRKLIAQTGKLIPLDRMHVCFVNYDPVSHTVTGFSRHMLIDYPVEFVNEYLEQGYAQIDGAWKVLEETGRPLIWHQMRRRFRSKAQKEMYGRADEFGLRDGFTFGARFSHSSRGSVFAGICDPRELIRYKRHLAIIDYLTPHLHGALARLQFGLLKQSPMLTERELSVINWAKYGKSDSEIALQIGVSARTVKFHVENAMHKLQACNRVQATAIAISQGLIEWC